ncbi:autotransporter domain-containing protein [uncultured Helicobacter sp.]|uniref:autotransporter outer membrane beta-barrel domain-containing protein n=1 Tax=uncultured Helicobacter sp. TaxID=175537 RepID=UPI00374F89C7
MRILGIIILAIIAYTQPLYALSNEWIGHMQDSSATLSNGQSHTITLKRDPSFGTNRGNNFGYQGSTSFDYHTSSGSSTIILQKDPNTSSTSVGSDMQYYHHRGNAINVYSGSNLIMNLNSTGSNGGFILNGGVINANGGRIEINNINTLSFTDGGQLIVQNGGEVEISGVTRFIIDTQGNAPSILNNNGTLTIKADVYNYPKQTYGSNTDGGYIQQIGGNTTITQNFYNAGYYNAVAGSRQTSLLQVEGGTFKVGGNFVNGDQCTSAYGTCYGIGIVQATGGVIEVGGRFSSTAQNGYRSSVRLENTTLQAGSVINDVNSDMYLVGSGRIESSSSFESKQGSTTHFVGSGNSFGLIYANSVSFGGDVRFSVGGVLKANNNAQYTFVDSASVSGLTQGAVNLTDANGSVANRYSASLSQTQSGGREQWAITLHKNAQVYDTGINGAIAKALDSEYIILTDNVLYDATNSIKTQLDSLQEQYKLMEGATIQHTMLGRVSNAKMALAKQKLYLAQNRSIYYGTAKSDYKIPLFDARKTHNFYINALAGYSGFKGTSGADYGVSFGYDEHRNAIFGGVYALIKKRNLGGSNMQFDSLYWQVGGYSRIYLKKSLELDMVGYYGNTRSDYTRGFALNTQYIAQSGSYGVHNLGVQMRLGPRKNLHNGQSIKPYLGILGSWFLSPSYDESGSVSLSRATNSFLNLYGVLGLEYRKIFEKGEFFASIEGAGGMPILGQEYQITMGNQSFAYKNPNEIFGNFFMGADFILHEHFNITASVMAQGYKSGFYALNGSVGIKFVF